MSFTCRDRIILIATSKFRWMSQLCNIFCFITLYQILVRYVKIGWCWCLVGVMMKNQNPLYWSRLCLARSLQLTHGANDHHLVMTYINMLRFVSLQDVSEYTLFPDGMSLCIFPPKNLLSSRIFINETM